MVDKFSIIIKSGVPQGGVLSGLLFILYINDMTHGLKVLKASLYADDAKLFPPLRDEDTENSIQEDLDSVSRRCASWHLRLNAQKIFFLQYTLQYFLQSFAMRTAQHQSLEQSSGKHRQCRELELPQTSTR